MNEIMKAVIDILCTDIRKLSVFEPRKKKKSIITSQNTDSPTSIITVASHYGPKRINEDRVCCGSSWGQNYIAVADGLGGYPHGGDAAQIAIETFQNYIKKMKQKDALQSYTFLQQVYQEASRKIKKKASYTHGWKTTLLCVIERQQDFLISYLGDGQIYLIRGDMQIAVPLMVGHRVNGLLAGVLGPDLTAAPASLQLSKSFQSGEIIVAGTDGIFDSRIEQIRPNLLVDLIGFIHSSLNTKQPDTILYDFLDQLNTQGLICDNASLGVIITAKARQHSFQGD